MGTERATTLGQEFATFLKAKRMAKGYTQRSLAEKIWGDDKRAEYIGKIENGRQISLSTMGILLEALDSWVEFIE